MPRTSSWFCFTFRRILNHRHQLLNFLMKGKIPFTYLNKHSRNGHPNFGVFGKVQKDFKKSLHYVWTGRRQIVGCFAKKIKIPFTYSHWEKAFVRPKSEIFTKNSESPLVMFALGEAKFGVIFEKFLIFLWRQKCCHYFKINLCSWQVDGRIAVIIFRQ